ncbi:hypothetical protein Tco_1549519 [Tanacetum coccineum]
MELRIDSILSTSSIQQESDFAFRQHRFAEECKELHLIVVKNLSRSRYQKYNLEQPIHDQVEEDDGINLALHPQVGNVREVCVSVLKGAASKTQEKVTAAVESRERLLLLGSWVNAAC